MALVNELEPDAMVRTAAQPSHDPAGAILFDYFDTNAVGALNLLEGGCYTVYGYQGKQVRDNILPFWKHWTTINS